MAGFRTLTSLELSDDEKLDRMFPEKEVSDYPDGMTFSVSEDQLADLDVDQADCQPGQTVVFAAMVECRSNMRREDSCRIEAEVIMLSLGDGKLTEILNGGPKK